VYNINFLTY